MEPEEGLEKVQDALRVCQSYQATYHDRRTNLGQYFKQGPTVEWQFRPTLVFARLDMCMEQLSFIKVRLFTLYLSSLKDYQHYMVQLHTPRACLWYTQYYNHPKIKANH